MVSNLQLRWEPSAVGPAEGWFLPGTHPARWLDELSRCGLASEGTRLFCVPRSLQDRTPAGLLVVPSTGRTPGATPAGFACRCIAGRLFVPVDATLDPPLSDAEVTDRCPFPVALFHPLLGLAGFDAGSTHCVADLLKTPAERPADWNRAVSAPASVPELDSIALDRPPTLGDMFGEASGEIGSEPVEGLPPASGEPSESAVSKFRRSMRKAISEGAAGAMRRLPHGGSRRTWVNAVEDWANRNLQQVDKQLSRLRNKEVHRLLDLLTRDPETGLRHAIPMNDFGHRGTAAPSSRLGPRNLDFDPGRLGGGPADHWDIPADIRELLRKRYLELANRELQLGRHRRAAYIFAQLLGDLVSSANALKQGRMFREAALLYENHLHNPLEAARCLAEGGLFADAIQLYTKLRLWLDVADLHDRLGNRAAATEALRRVVNDRLASDDPLGAARLLDERLHVPDEAIAVLLAAWPGSRQAISALSVAIQLLARLGRHSEAAQRIEEFRTAEIRPAMLPAIAAMLADTARDYPGESVRLLAADTTRVVIARGLADETAPESDASRLVEHLVRLAPQDRLLARDGNRHLDLRRERERERARLRRKSTPLIRPSSTPASIHLRPIRRFMLPGHDRWVDVRSQGSCFVALSEGADRIVCVRGAWTGETQSVRWDVVGTDSPSGWFLEPGADRGLSFGIARPGGQPLPSRLFPPADTAFHQTCTIGTPRGLPVDSHRYIFTTDSLWSIHIASSRVVLSVSARDGTLQHTVDLTAPLLDGATQVDSRLAMAAFGRGVAIAFGNRLLLYDRDQLSRHDIPGQTRGLAVTPPHTRGAVAVLLDRGASVLWQGSAEWIEVDSDLPAPHGAFIPGGPLALVSGRKAVISEVDSRGVHGVTRVELPGRNAVGVCATHEPGEFAVLDTTGEMIVYSVRPD